MYDFAAPAGRVVKAIRHPVLNVIPALVDRVLHFRSDAGLSARERADSVGRGNKAFGTLPSDEQVARSIAAARRRAADKHGHPS